VLARGSSAAVLGVLPAHPSGPVEVLVTTKRRSRPGVLVHRTQHLPAGDVRIFRGLPVTSPVRTVLDLAGGLGDDALERLVAEVLAREPGAAVELAERGTARIRGLVVGGPRRTRSENERRLLRIVRGAGLPLPRTNAVVCGEEVDAYWPGQRLVVEVDAFSTHGDRVAFERDRRKRAALTARGFAVLAITDRRLEGEPLAVAATLAGALATARPA
jgi:very-short-patch-repair endonuclease